ncbi:MAG: hypothetical protein EYC70_05635 [Planctomycetota bacterium]|nr:MAG: hypothetical protein EYC70_05635 [Planctomycetota bacterium]
MTSSLATPAISYRLLRRAVGAYGDEVLAHLGSLFLRAAVLARMHIRDGNIYEPDPSLIEPDAQRLRVRLRSLWREALELPAGAGSVFRELQHAELSPSAASGRLDWNDALSMARMSVALRPNDPHARIALFINLFRNSNLREAAAQLSAIRMPEQYGPVLHARVLWNRAGPVEYEGDTKSAVALLRRCLELDPTNPSYRRDYLAYALASGHEETALRALSCVRSVSGPHVITEDVKSFLQREQAPVTRMLGRNQDLMRSLNRALDRRPAAAMI